MPQGWGFFTKSPREEQIVIYKYDDNINRYKLISQRHTSPQNLFGINRRASKIFQEFNMSIENYKYKIPYLDTVFNYQNTYHIENFNFKKILVKNPVQDPILCGNYVIVYQKTIPWAWSRKIKSSKYPCKFLKIKFECKN